MKKNLIKDKDYILKSPVRRIHKVKTRTNIKETYSDEALELARTKIHLQNYLESRTDDNPTLFVSLQSPHNRMKIGGIEVRLRQLGERLRLNKVHPHKFRRTLATMAIDKGMPIEQLQQLLTRGGDEVRLDTIGRNIRKYRLIRKYRQEDLAEKTGLSTNYIGMFERGEKIPSLETFINILNALDVSADVVFGDVLVTGYTIKNSILDEKLGKLPNKEQRKIYEIIDTLIKYSNTN